MIMFSFVNVSVCFSICIVTLSTSFLFHSPFRRLMSALLSSVNEMNEQLAVSNLYIHNRLNTHTKNKQVYVSWWWRRAIEHNSTFHFSRHHYKMFFILLWTECHTVNTTWHWYSCHLSAPSINRWEFLRCIKIVGKLNIFVYTRLYIWYNVKTTRKLRTFYKI